MNASGVKCPRCSGVGHWNGRDYVCENKSCPIDNFYGSVQENRGIREYIPLSEPRYPSKPDVVKKDDH